MLGGDGVCIYLYIGVYVWFRVSGLCHACMWRIGVQVLSALNPVDPLHNCMFENKLCLQNVFAKIILQCSGRLRKLEI